MKILATLKRFIVPQTMFDGIGTTASHHLGVIGKIGIEAIFRTFLAATLMDRMIRFTAKESNFT